MPNAAPDSVLLPKGTVLAVARFAAPSRAQLYTLDGAPAWLDTRAGRPDDLSPTVRLCSRYWVIHHASYLHCHALAGTSLQQKCTPLTGPIP